MGVDAVVSTWGLNWVKWVWVLTSIQLALALTCWCWAHILVWVNGYLVTIVCNENSTAVVKAGPWLTWHQH